MPQHVIEIYHNAGQRNSPYEDGPPLKLTFSHWLNADRMTPEPGREQLYAFAAQVAALTAEGDDGDGEPFVIENDDAWATLNQLIAAARELLHTFQDCACTAKGCRMAQPAPSPDRLSKKED